MSVASCIAKSVLSVDQVADVIEDMQIEDTTDLGDAIVHVGRDAAGNRIILVSTCGGNGCMLRA